MYNKKTLTFTFHRYWGAICQGAFVLDLVYIYLKKYKTKEIVYVYTSKNPGYLFSGSF